MNVTVCIPCYGQADYLPRAIEAALGQTRPALELIVVDDGHPNDAVRDVTRRYMDGNTTATAVRYVRVSNRGLPGARNTGVMLARGDAFLPLDADDWISPNYLARTVPLLADGADVVCTGLEEHGTREGTYWPEPHRSLNELRQYNRLFYCSLMRTQLLREVGGYNGRMIHGYEDWDLWLDLKRRDVRFAVVGEVLFHYTTKNDSMLMDTERNWRQWNIDEMARHHGW